MTIDPLAISDGIAGRLMHAHSQATDEVVQAVRVAVMAAYHQGWEDAFEAFRRAIADREKPSAQILKELEQQVRLR
jgi:hypothetical protein